jgi:hypothetical protein
VDFETANGRRTAETGLCETVHCCSLIFVVAHIAAPELSKVYQNGALHFVHLLPALKACKSQLVRIFENNIAWRELKNDWVNRFQSKLGILTEVDEEFVKNLTKTYACARVSSKTLMSVTKRKIYSCCEILTSSIRNASQAMTKRGLHMGTRR